MDVAERISYHPSFEEITGEEHFLVLHNDDVHTFDFVIASLIEICRHDVHQAEQCAYIVHYLGKCDVKKGTYDFLHPMKDQLISKGLSVTID
ncbi:MAG: ATP-dependent Clp protease adaptor ClpS [Bacteroidales bacterium]|nr:ATP-dependent Clp protease adaptor ClpS [Bacteroidales bacterium]